MKLDTERQRQALLKLISDANIPGSAFETVFELKRAIETASIEGQPVLPTFSEGWDDLKKSHPRPEYPSMAGFDRAVLDDIYWR